MNKAALFLAFGVLALALPTTSYAGTVCYTDNDDPALASFYVLNISPGCTKTTKTAELHGKVFFANPEVDCGGVGRIWPVDGACFGVALQNKVVVGFRVTSEGPGCVSRSTLVSGTSLSSSLTGFTRPDSSTNAAITLTPTSCSSAPTQ
jgi:hypothetical protein